MRKFIRYMWPFLLILFLIFFSKTATAGARFGLKLWAENIVPTLLPFLLLSNILIHNGSMSYLVNHPTLKRFRPELFICIFNGFLCGYPMGGKFVHDLYAAGFLDRHTANRLLVLCSNASPMFIMGYTYLFGLEEAIPVWLLLGAIYLPNIILFLLRNTLSKKEAFYSAYFTVEQEPKTLPELLSDSIESILTIGVYIMLFSILATIFSSVSLTILTVPVSALEITIGTAILKAAPYTHIKKTALIVALTSFGGVSSIAQTMSVAHHAELSFIKYIFWKLVLAAVSGILVYTVLLRLPAI